MFTVVSVRNRTSQAAASDIAIATTLTRALRHWNRNAPSTRISRIAPITAARPRLSNEASMNSAGR